MRFRRESKELQRAHEALNGAPGPSPWYLQLQDAPQIRSSKAALQWSEPEEREPFLGKTLLSSAGETVGIVGFYCYVKVLQDPLFVVWHKEEPRSSGTVVAKKELRVSVIDSDLLEPIANVEEVCEGMDSTKEAAYFAEGVIDSVSIRAALDEGEHRQEFPESLRSLDELLVLDSLEGLKLLVVNPPTDSLTVFPQDWFNKGDFDFGYQWVTRVARDKDSGVIFGEGIRLGVFELDESNRSIARWLAKEPFYGPYG